MKTDKEITCVMFRKEPKKHGGQILALFPYESTRDGYTVLSYVHIGQHSEAGYDRCMQLTKPAKPEEYANLASELTGLGYNLKVIKRAQRNKMYKQR